MVAGSSSKVRIVFPNVAIKIVSAAALQARHALVRDEFDVAIVSGPDAQLQVDASRCLYRRLIHDEFVALFPTNRSKAGRPFLVAIDFVDETYITNSALPERNREYELFFQPYSMYPERVVRAGFTGAILELAAAWIGTTIGTRWIMASDTQNSKIVSLPLTKKGLFVHWLAICSRRKEIEAQARVLCEAVTGKN